MTIKISRTTDTTIAFNLQAYQDLSVLKADLTFTNTLSASVQRLAESIVMSVPAATVASLPLGKTVATFAVKKQNGNAQVSFLVDVEIVDGSVSGNEIVYLSIPNIITIPTGGGSGAVDDLVNGRVKVNKFLFADTDDNEFLVTAIMDGGYPTLKVENTN